MGGVQQFAIEALCILQSICAGILPLYNGSKITYLFGFKKRDSSRAEVPEKARERKGRGERNIFGRLPRHAKRGVNAVNVS
jgi:hypothetical protein